VGGGGRGGGESEVQRGLGKKETKRRDKTTTSEQDLRNEGGPRRGILAKEERRQGKGNLKGKKKRAASCRDVKVGVVACGTMMKFRLKGGGENSTWETGQGKTHSQPRTSRPQKRPNEERGARRSSRSGMFGRPAEPGHHCIKGQMESGRDGSKRGGCEGKLAGKMRAIRTKRSRHKPRIPRTRR